MLADTRAAMAYAMGPVPVSRFPGQRGRPVWRCLLLALGLAWLLGGCTGQRQHFQALAPGAETTEGIRDGLVLMPLRVWPLQANLRLAGMRLVDTATGDRHQLVFFGSETLGSRAVPHRKLEFEIAQTALFDLPPGRYRLEAVDVAFLWQKDSPGIASIVLERELVLPVGASPGYAGRLTVEIEQLSITDDFGTRDYEFPLTEPVRLYSIEVELRVAARVRIEDRLEDDLVDAVAEYPGLEDRIFVKRLVR